MLFSIIAFVKSLDDCSPNVISQNINGCECKANGIGSTISNCAIGNVCTPGTEEVEPKCLPPCENNKVIANSKCTCVKSAFGSNHHCDVGQICVRSPSGECYDPCTPGGIYSISPPSFGCVCLKDVNNDYTGSVICSHGGQCITGDATHNPKCITPDCVDKEKPFISCNCSKKSGNSANQRCSSSEYCIRGTENGPDSVCVKCISNSDCTTWDILLGHICSPSGNCIQCNTVADCGVYGDKCTNNKCSCGDDTFACTENGKPYCVEHVSGIGKFCSETRSSSGLKIRTYFENIFVLIIILFSLIIILE